MRSFQLTVETRDKAVIAHLSGEAGNDEGESLRHAFAELAATRPDRVVIDMRGLSYIATVGLGELISFREQLATGGGRLQLAGAEPRIAELFRQTRLREVFPMYPDAEAALSDPQH
jgi:anti-sigma B factor antagonist